MYPTALCLHLRCIPHVFLLFKPRHTHSSCLQAMRTASQVVMRSVSERERRQSSKASNSRPQEQKRRTGMIAWMQRGGKQASHGGEASKQASHIGEASKQASHIGGASKQASCGWEAVGGESEGSNRNSSSSSSSANRNHQADPAQPRGVSDSQQTTAGRFLGTPPEQQQQQRQQWQQSQLKQGQPSKALHTVAQSQHVHRFKIVHEACSFKPSSASEHSSRTPAQLRSRTATSDGQLLLEGPIHASVRTALFF